MFPDTSRGLIGIVLGFLACYWFSTLSILESILILRFFSLGLLCFAIYVYVSDFKLTTLCVFIEDEPNLSDKLEEVKELVETPAPSTPTEESAEFADLVSEKNRHTL